MQKKMHRTLRCIQQKKRQDMHPAAFAHNRNPRPADAAQLVTCTTRQVGFLFGMSALPTSVYTREACCSMPKLSVIPY